MVTRRGCEEGGACSQGHRSDNREWLDGAADRRFRMVNESLRRRQEDTCSALGSKMKTGSDSGISRAGISVFVCAVLARVRRLRKSLQYLFVILQGGNNSLRNSPRKTSTKHAQTNVKHPGSRTSPVQTPPSEDPDGFADVRERSGMFGFGILVRLPDIGMQKDVSDKVLLTLQLFTLQLSPAICSSPFRDVCHSQDAKRQSP